MMRLASQSTLVVSNQLHRCPQDRGIGMFPLDSKDESQRSSGHEVSSTHDHQLPAAPNPQMKSPQPLGALQQVCHFERHPQPIRVSAREYDMKNLSNKIWIVLIAFLINPANSFAQCTVMAGSRCLDGPPIQQSQQTRSATNSANNLEIRDGRLDGDKLDNGTYELQIDGTNITGPLATKVLLTCRIGDLCIVAGITRHCRGVRGACSEFSSIRSVKRQFEKQ